MKIRTNKYFLVSLIALGFLLSSCGPSRQERRDEIEKSMQIWVGKTETELVTKWGPPAHTYKLADGAKELTYYGHSTYHSYYYYYYPRYWGRTERGFTLDKNGIITAYRWDGY